MTYKKLGEEKRKNNEAFTYSTTHFFCFQKLLFFNVKRKSCYTTKNLPFIADVLWERARCSDMVNEVCSAAASLRSGY